MSVFMCGICFNHSLSHLSLFSALFLLIFVSCDKEFPDSHDISDQLALEKSSSPVDVGRMNVVKKCYQMTEFLFTPKNVIEYNIGSYYPDHEYQGMIYSSVTETGTFAGLNVSLYTIKSAINNPRSVIYTENIGQPPYHGTNCTSYYGIACSTLLSYAFDFHPSIGVIDIPFMDSMTEITDIPTDSLKIADLLWNENHVMVITDVYRDKNRHVTFVEISEAAQEGCAKSILPATLFRARRGMSYERIYRYNNLEKNYKYIPAPDVVPIFSETPTAFAYNYNLCVNKGDRSNYLTDEDVIINVFQKADYLEIWRDGSIVSTISLEDNQTDINLGNLLPGTYKARTVSASYTSDFTEWIVVDLSFKVNKGEGTVSFSSSNATPVLFSFCSISGKRMKHTMTELFVHPISSQEVSNKSLTVQKDKMPSDCPYFVFLLSTEFGRIQTNPVRW